MRGRTARLGFGVLILAGALSVGLGGGCASGGAKGGSTRFTVSDIEYTSAELSAQLAGASFLQGRGPGSPEIRLMPGEFANISTERIGEADRWVMISRVLHDPGIFELLRSKNVSIVMPEQRRRLFERFAIADAAGHDVTLEDGGVVHQPATVRFEDASIATHALNTTFLSATRTATDNDDDANERKELFVVQTEIIDLGSGRAIWSGQTQFARVARGLILD